MTLVSVIVPARDASETIGRTLDALSRQDHPDLEVIIVDDGSTDGTPELAEASPLRPTVVRNPRPAGAGAARDLGAAHASGDVLAFTDADCEPQPGWVRAGIDALDWAELVQGRVIPDPQAERGPFDRTLGVARETGLYETANLFIRRADHARIGGFGSDAATFTGDDRQATRPFGEDTQFGWRARRSGLNSAFAPEALVHHAVFPRGPRDFIAERGRLREFPGLVRRVPEFRREVLHRRVFLSPRTAAFDAAVLSTVVAPLLPLPRGLRIAVAVGGSLPYSRLLYAGTRRTWPKRRPLVLLVDLAADARALVALATGSVEQRTPVL